MDRLKLIIDTDIGDDIDDLQALTLALLSPEVDLLAVTTVCGDTARRAKLVGLLLEATGRTEVPVASGAGSPLLHPGRATQFDGHNLDLSGVQLEPVETPAALLLTQLIQTHQGRVSLLTLGALTNVALALSLDPRLPGKVHQYHLMGGCFTARPELHHRVEYNIRCDPEAASVVFAAGFNLTIVGLDITTQVELSRDHLDPLRGSSHPLAKLYVAAVEDYLSIHRRNHNVPHDAVTLATLLSPDIITTESLDVAVELRGEYTRGVTVDAHHSPVEGLQLTPARVAVAVDGGAFRKFYLDRLYTLCER